MDLVVNAYPLILLCRVGQIELFHTIVEMAGETEDLQRLPDVNK